MVNTRSGSGVDQPAQVRPGRARASQAPPQAPAPAAMADPPQNDMQALLAAQTQLIQAMAAQMTNMQAQINQQQQQFQQQQFQQQQQPQQQPRDKHREFMSHKPPSFSHAPDPLQADDWLKTVGKMLTISQCSDREKVMYASGRLTGSAADRGTLMSPPMQMQMLSLGRSSAQRSGSTIFQQG